MSNSYDDIKRKLKNDYNIKEDIFSHAKMMDTDIVKLFCDNLKKKNKEALISTILGIYGNYFASHEFIMKGYKIHNEYDILDGKKKVTKADIAYYDENNNLVLCEVKAARQILKNKNNYIYYDYSKNKKDIELDKKKYYEIGKKLINQVTKLKKESDFVKVIIFENCVLDNDLLSDLYKLGIKKTDIITIPIDIINLHNYVEKMVMDILY